MENNAGRERQIPYQLVITNFPSLFSTLSEIRRVQGAFQKTPFPEFHEIRVHGRITFEEFVHNILRIMMNFFIPLLLLDKPVNRRVQLRNVYRFYRIGVHTDVQRIAHIVIESVRAHRDDRNFPVAPPTEKHT